MGNEHKRRGEESRENGSFKRRNRAVLSCMPCKKHKVRCDHNIPCGRCARRHEEHLCITAQPDVASEQASQVREVILDPKASLHTSPFIWFMKEYHPHSALRDATSLLESGVGKGIYFPNKMRMPLSHLKFLRASKSGFKDRAFLTASKKKNILGEDKAKSAYDSLKPESGTSMGETSFLSGEWSYKSSVYVDESGDEENIKFMRETTKQLPAFDFLQAAINHYFDHMSWFVPLIPRSVFQSTFEAFHELITVDHVPPEHIDPAFISILFSMSSFAVFTQHLPITFAGHTFVPGSWENLGLIYFTAAKKALKASQWLDFPSLRKIQAALFIVNLITCFIEQKGARGQSYVVLCYHQCLKLNFHAHDFQLGITVPLDPCIPPNNVLLNRELRRRALAVVCLYYLFTVSTCGVSGDAANFPKHPLPKNCDIEELLNPLFFSSSSSVVEKVPEAHDALIDHPSTEILDSWIALAHISPMGQFSPLAYTRVLMNLHETIKDLRSAREIENVIARSTCALTGVQLVVDKRKKSNQSAVSPNKDKFTLPVDGFDSESNIDILTSIPINPPHLTQKQLWMHHFVLCRAFRTMFQLNNHFARLYCINGSYPLSLIKLIRVSRALLHVERTHSGCFVEDTNIWMSFLQRTIFTILMTTHLRETATRFSNDILSPELRARFHELLEPKLLKADVCKCRSLVMEIKQLASDKTEPFANRSSYAQSCIEAIEPLLFVAEQSLGLGDPSVIRVAPKPTSKSASNPPSSEASHLSTAVGENTSSQEQQLFDLNHFFALSDDLDLMSGIFNDSFLDSFRRNGL